MPHANYNTYLDVARIKEIMKTEKPYRGNDKRFPFSYRHQRNKYFLVDELNGETIYRIIYGETSLSTEITTEQYKEYSKKKMPKDEKLADYSYTDNGVKVERYYLIKSAYNEMGIVREDNTFEYTGKKYHQGDNNFMSSAFMLNQVCSSKHGGLILYKNKPNVRYGLKADAVDLMIPIYKGLRIHLDTFEIHKSCDYKMTSYKVNRKKSKEFLKQYEDFYTIGETMMKSMDAQQFIELAYEIIMDEYTHEVYDSYYIGRDKEQELIKVGHECMDEKPIDSLIMFAVAYDVNSFWYRLRSHASVLKTGNKNYYYNREDLHLDTFFESIKRKLNKEIYKANPSVMKIVEHEKNKYYPPSDWGLQVTVNGVEVEQYK